MGYLIKSGILWEGEVFWHLYLYCDGDPVNNTDNEGHAAYSLYNSSDDAAKNFVLTMNSQTHADHRERGAMIFRVKVAYKAKPKTKVTRFFYGKVYKGGHNNVVWAFICERFLKVAVSGRTLKNKNKGVASISNAKKFAFVHTHPNCKGHDNEIFSREDKSLVNQYGMTFCYLGTPSGKLKRYGILTTVISNKMPKARLPEYECR